MTDNDQPEPWHISRAVSVTHIFSTMAIVGALFVFLSDVNSRIGNNTLNIQHLQQTQIDDRKSSEKRYDDFRTDLQIINKKLDRLIEYTRKTAGE